MTNQFQGIKQSNKIILLKITSRERPDILIETVAQWLKTANNTKDMVLLFSFDIDDPTNTVEFSNRLCKLLEPYDLGIRAQAFDGKSTGKINAINRDVKEFRQDWDILVNVSDDQRPIVKGWDDIIRRAMPDDLDASLWFTDGQPRINTQEIIGKTYYNRFGYIYHPDFKSLWCDNLATDIALFLGKCIRSNKQIVKHHHPAWGGSEAFKRDALYDRNDKFWNEDEATYRRLKSQGLDKLVNK